MLVITCKGEEAGSKLCFSSVCKLPGALTWIVWAPKWNRWSSTNDASLAPGRFYFQTWAHKIKEEDGLIIGIPRNLRQTCRKQANGPITELENITSLMTPSNDCNPAVQRTSTTNTCDCECSPASVIWGSLHAMIGPLSPTTGSFASNDCKTDTSYLRTLIRFMWDTMVDGIWGSNIEVQRTASIRGFTDLHAIDHWTNKWLRAFYSNSSDNQRPNVFAKFSKL
jgi:hypothetical protein